MRIHYYEHKSTMHKLNAKALPRLSLDTGSALTQVFSVFKAEPRYIWQRIPCANR